MKFAILKLILIITTILICCDLITSLQSKIGMATNLKANMFMNSHNKLNLHEFLSKHKKYLSRSNTKISELNRLHSKILFSGWMKYFKYLDDDTKKAPKEFFKNTLFEKDSRRKHATGEDKIPSEKYFYGVMFADSLNIFNSNNKNTVQQSYDVLSIDYIRSIPENKQTKGGVRDFGKFSEGYCFQIKTIIPKKVFKMTATEYDPTEGKKEKWLICLDQEVRKQSLMNLIIKNKIRKQEEAGVILKTPEATKTISQSNPLSAAGNSVESLTIKPSVGAKIDGRWVVLQDWTQCSLACGGGIQTLQLMCHPPANGGKPCKGENIRKRACNPQPCPVIKSGAEAPIKFEKPIVKMMPLTQRPSRYDKCHLKENDIFAVLRPEGMNLADLISTNADYLMSDKCSKIPARIVLTQKSVAVYKDQNLESITFTGDIESVVFTKIPKSETCFLLQGKNQNQQIVICSMESRNSFVEEWDYDFSLFKHQCQEKRPIIKLNNDSEARRKFTEGIQTLKTEIVEEKANKAKANSQKDEEIQIKKQVDNTQSMTFLAMQKEMKLEALLEKEEELREKDDEGSLDIQLKQEEKKKNILMKSIKEKELEEQFNISRENAKLAINRIKDEAKNSIIKKRDEIKKKIMMMRMKSERKKAAVRSKIMSMRNESVQKLHLFGKKGNMEKCFIPDPAKKDDLHNIEVYCVANFATDMSEFMECKIPESFCYSCCEREYGPLLLKFREECYNTRCKAEK